MKTLNSLFALDHIPLGDLTAPTVIDFIASGYLVTPSDNDYKIFITLPTGMVKVYLDDPTWTDSCKAKFVKLLNTNAVNLAFPFTVLPYFIEKE